MLYPLCGAFLGTYMGYIYANERKQFRWGKYANRFYPNIFQIGLFGSLGLGIGYCMSKLL
jgi:hypothetical protein